MRSLVQRHQNRIADGEIIALRAERGQNTGAAVVDGSRDQQRDDADGKEDDAFGDEDGQQKGPVDGAPVQLDQREEDERWQRKCADKCVEAFGLLVGDDFQQTGQIARRVALVEETLQCVSVVFEERTFTSQFMIRMPQLEYRRGLEVHGHFACSIIARFVVRVRVTLVSVFHVWPETITFNTAIASSKQTAHVECAEFQ